MKDKENQIEEMAKVLCYDYGDLCSICTNKCNTDLIVNVLYNKGYRKIDKDSVVLTEEEYNIIDHNIKHLESVCNNIQDYTKELEESLKQARRETAREIFEYLYMQFSADYLLGFRNEYKDWRYADLIKRYAKQYGVEVE